MKSLLFVNPDYHSSFLLKEALKKRGWKASLLKPSSYPSLLLYSEECETAPSFKGKWFKCFRKIFYFLKLAIKYKYFVVYGTPFIFELFSRSRTERLAKKQIYPDLMLLKSFGKKIIYLPSGCNGEMLQADFKKYYPALCANCGWAAADCNDVYNQQRFDAVNKHVDFVIGSPLRSPRIKTQQVRYSSLDLALWHPEIEIPEEHRQPATNNVRIMHAFFNKGREHGNKNIKGSPFVVAAIEQLKREGFAVEYFYATSIPSVEMRFYQAQADIIVDQLIYGWWGSTGREALSLGKPTVCYLDSGWKENFYAAFPDSPKIPIVEATVHTIYEVLKRLVEDKAQRLAVGRASRQFAEAHYDVQKNAAEFEKLLLNL